MANLAAAIKEEIQRLARKEIKSQTGSTKQAVSQYRREIASLKRQMRKQETKIAFLEAHEKKRMAEPPGTEDTAEGVRFSAAFCQSAASETGILGCRLCQTRGRLVADRLQLGTRQNAAASGTACGAGGRTRHREA